MQRRQFLVSPLFLGCIKPGFGKSTDVNYVAASRGQFGSDSIVCLDADGNVVCEHSVPSRGHSFAVSSQGNIAAIARRPANFCLILDLAGNKVTEFQAPVDRHFYGHGVFDLSGDFLYLTENDFDSARGVIGIYHARDKYRRVGEFNTYGVGPHQILLNSDASQLIVANGGIETHPYSGRKKLNLSSMQPSIVFIDRKTGALTRHAELEFESHANSIRHLAVKADDTVYLGLQNEGAESNAVLIAEFLPSNNTIEMQNVPISMLSKLNDYVGDICLDQSEQYLAVSSPLGNTLLIRSLEYNKTWSLTIDDVCGLAATKAAGQFIATCVSGLLCLVDVQNNNDEPLIQKINDFKGELAWDNHIALL